MKRSWFWVMLVAVLAGVIVSGCCCPGGRSKTTVNNSTTTTGQQLMDLQKARESGAISEKDYNKQKKEILRKSK